MKFLEESASAVNGVMAVENPIPIDMAINIKLFPRETAASSAVSQLSNHDIINERHKSMTQHSQHDRSRQLPIVTEFFCVKRKVHG